MGKRVVASVELELHSLRARLVAVSEQITGQLAGLAQRIGVAPPATQASLLILAGQIATAQQRLRDETDRLVGHPAECAAILQIALQAQLAVSNQLANLLAAAQTSPHIGTKLANIAQQLTQVHRSDPSTTGHQTWEVATERGEHNDLSAAEANAWIPLPIASLSPREDGEASRRPDDNLGYTWLGKIGASLSAVAADTSSRSLALAACLLCGLFVAYTRLGASDQQELSIR